MCRALHVDLSTLATERYPTAKGIGRIVDHQRAVHRIVVAIAIVGPHQCAAAGNQAGENHAQILAVRGDVDGFRTRGQRRAGGELDGIAAEEPGTRPAGIVQGLARALLPVKTVVELNRRC